MSDPTRIRSADLDGLPQTINYNGDGTVDTIVCVEILPDGSTTTYTQTYTYPSADQLVISEWVGVNTP